MDYKDADLTALGQSKINKRGQNMDYLEIIKLELSRD